MFGFISSKSAQITPEAPILQSPTQMQEMVAPAKERLKIKYQRDLNILVIKGRSNSLELLPAYVRLIEGIKRHFLKKQKLVCYLQYEVINASTTKLLFNLLSVFRKAQKAGRHVVVHWMAEENNDELIEIGKDLQAYFTNFNIVTL